MTEPSAASAPPEQRAPTADDRPASAPGPTSAGEPTAAGGEATTSPDGDQVPAEPSHGHSHREDRRPPGADGDRPVSRRRRLLTRTALVLLVLALAGVTTAAAHLWRTSDAWTEQAGEYQQAAQDVGAELAGTRAELQGTRAELEAVRGQLTNANTRIAELANEKAQIGDDREAQRQLVDYQERVTEAAGDVALALDQCVQGQQQLITYLRDQAAAPEGEEPYDATELEQFSGEVDTLCDAATEANGALQAELER